MQPQSFPYIVPICNEKIDILYEDDYLLLIHKPAFLLSMPGRHPDNKDSVITRLTQTWPSASLVHRLDLDTSGIMVIPKTKFVHADISKQFQARSISKTYIAVVDGLLTEAAGTIELPIAKDWQNRPLQKICHDTGKASTTHFKVIEKNTGEKITRLELTPITGRTHQLRIHLSTIGHPILGCDLYATDVAFKKANRLLLHAQKLTLTHPIYKKPLSMVCEPAF
ncbi:MAG: pseudouridine synthase [Cellvibrionales bacterium]|nr:pseudouridine synthase [Cellvibrionales bacterium]